MKRFYLNNSVMNYHPKQIMVTCVYLACKVDEFNVPMEKFVANVKGDNTKARDFVLNNELMLMEQLKFHLTTHNPFRSVEGFLIDIKVCNPISDRRTLSLNENVLFTAIQLEATPLPVFPSGV